VSRAVSLLTALVLVALLGLAAPDLCAAQSVSASEREALVRLRVDQGGRAEDIDALIRYGRRGGREGIAGRTADEQECTGAQARWRIMWLTYDGQNRKCRFEILTMPGVAQSLMSLLLQGEFR